MLGLIKATAIWLTPIIRITDCRDADDNKYLELALAAGATMLVTSDNDLLALRPWRNVRIVLPAEYVGIAHAR